MMSQKTERQYRLDRYSRCFDVKVPEDEDLRAVALEAFPSPTPALDAFRAALAWRDGRRCGCVAMVGGSRGLGKSSALAWALLTSNSSALYVPASEIGATPRNGFSTNEERWEEWLTVHLLGVDDLGLEAGDPEAVAALFCRRFDRGLRTFVTTNLDRSAVAERYFRGGNGPRLADRLINAQGCGGGDDGLPWYITLTGESLRRPEARAALPPPPPPPPGFYAEPFRFTGPKLPARGA